MELFLSAFFLFLGGSSYVKIDRRKEFFLLYQKIVMFETSKALILAFDSGSRMLPGGKKGWDY
jgi:hypothetical protein